MVHGKAAATRKTLANAQQKNHESVAPKRQKTL